MIRSLLTIVFLSTTLSACMHKRVKELEAEVEQQRDEIRTLQASQAGYVVQVEQLKGQLDGVRGENAELVGYYDDLTNEFSDELGTGELQLVMYPDRTVLALSEDLHFETGSDGFTAEGEDALARLASVVQRHPERTFQIEGHTDSRPIHNADYDSNWELGAARSIAVVKELIAAGVPAKQVYAATFADASPIASGSDEAMMAENRRILVAVDLTLEETLAQARLLEKAQNRVTRPVAAADADEL